MTARRAEWVYALLLRAYPADFRRAYAREMTLVFRDVMRVAGASRISCWMAIVADVARSAPALRAEALRARWNADIRLEESVMKTMGALAVLIGLVQIANGSIELSAGGSAGVPGLVVALFVVLGLLLVVTGVALVRRSSSAPMLAQITAISWLVLVVVVRAVHPVMSIFAMLLAIVFPVALLVYVWMGRGRGMSRAA